MLDNMRNMMGGVVAKILIGLLVISFAVWGASDAFIGGASTDAVTAGETKVGLIEYRLAYLNQANGLQRQLGQRLSREQLRAFGLDQAVLNQVVTGAILDEVAREMSLGVSEDRLAEMIGEDPSFQDATGAFSRQRLDFLLREAGMREEDFIRSREAVAVRSQLVSSLAAGAELPEAFYEALRQYRTQQRVFDYVNISRDDLVSVPEPTQSELEAYYEENKDAYMAPEYRRLQIVRLTAEDLAKPGEVTREEIESEYERVSERYAEPEKRRVLQLNFPDEQAAEAAAERLAAGESFETLMQEMGRAMDDVELGLLTRAQIPEQNIADAAFSLAEGETSSVVSGVFGPVILKVPEIQPEARRPIDEVEDELRQAIAIEKATDEIYEIHDRLEDERAAGDPLAEAARKVGLDARTIEMVDRSGRDAEGATVDGIPQSTEVLQAAFETDEGVETDPVPIDTSGFVWYEVADIIDERQKPLSEVRGEVAEAWRKAQVAERTKELAQTISERVAAGGDFATVVAETLPASDEAEAQAALQTSSAMNRTETSADLPAAAVAAGFSVAGGSVTTAPGPGEADTLVLKVREVIEGEPEEIPAQARQQLNDALADGIIGNVIGDLQTRVDVTINRQAIETAISY
jgi:peptidyl-prolyl cis-trans isomerase D